MWRVLPNTKIRDQTEGQLQVAYTSGIHVASGPYEALTIVCRGTVGALGLLPAGDFFELSYCMLGLFRTSATPPEAC